MKRRTLFPLMLCVLLTGTALGGKPTLPDLTLRDLDGHKQKLTDLRGDVVVLSFWATWCTPCQEELPRLSELSEHYAGKPVRFIAVSIDEDKSRSQLSAFLTKRAIYLETWTGASTATMKALGMGDIVPATVILDEKGEPITRISGEAQVEDVVSRVDWLLSGRSGPTPSSFLKRF